MKDVSSQIVHVALHLHDFLALTARYLKVENQNQRVLNTGERKNLELVSTSMVPIANKSAFHGERVAPWLLPTSSPPIWTSIARTLFLQLVISTDQQSGFLHFNQRRFVH